MELYNLGVEEARSAIDKGDVSPEELVSAVFKRIGEVDGKVKSSKGKFE